MFTSGILKNTLKKNTRRLEEKREDAGKAAQENKSKPREDMEIDDDGDGVSDKEKKFPRI